MKQLFLMVDSGDVKLIETPAPTPKPNTVIVETLYSVVSAGTERGLTSFGGKNLIQKVMERPDQAKKVMDKVSTDGFLTAMDAAFNKLGEPMPMGYTGVGKVVSVGRGVTSVAVGDLVAMAGTAYHAEVNRVGKNLITKIPDGFPDVRQAALCALGGIALQGIHQAHVQPGETVGVIGLGLVGHIVARILNAYGCDVIGYDIADKSMAGTRLKAFIKSDDENAEQKTRAFTNDRGVDKIIITAACDNNAPMDLAAAIARDRATICMIGVTKMDIDRRPYYKKELSFTIARSYGPGRYESDYEEKGIDIPIGQVRFTEGRNIEEYIRLIATGRADFSDLITHEIPFEDATRAYEMITTNKNKERYIAILLKYDEHDNKFAKTVHVAGIAKTPVDKDMISIGLIGAGNFARATMLPHMKNTGLYVFRGLTTTGGVNAAQAANENPFSYVTNDYNELLQDADIDLIAVSTQHNSHAKFVLEALRAGKSVYCEKPLCLTLDELDEIEEAYHNNAGELFCGMNRRYSPLVAEIKSELKTNAAPAVYDYIGNVGEIPSDHWTQDELAGGGRLIGEAVHFIDTIQYLDGSELESLNLTYMDSEAYPCKDNAFITFRFASGAIGNVIYTSAGSKRYPKEQLRVFSGGSICVMDNYLSLETYGNTKKRSTKLRQDKGFDTEYKTIADVLKNGCPNQAIEDAFMSHRKLLETLGN